MADKPQGTGGAADNATAAASNAFADSTAKAQEAKLTEAGPGHYYVVNGVKVDPDGKPLKPED